MKRIAQIVVALVALALCPASSAQAAVGTTQLRNATVSQAKLLTWDLYGNARWLSPGQESISSGIIPKDYHTAYGWCTNLYDYTNDYRRIIKARLPEGEKATLPWVGHDYVVSYYPC